MRNTTDRKNSSTAAALRLLAVTLLLAMLAVLSPAIASAQDSEPAEEPTAEPAADPTAEPAEEPAAEPAEEPAAEPNDAEAGPADESTVLDDSRFDGFDVTFPRDEQRPLVAEAAAADCSVNFSPDRLRSDYRVGRSVGTHRAAVLFIDFPDAPATETPQTLMNRVWSEGPGYVESMSGGALDVQMVPRNNWIRMSRPEADYEVQPAIEGTASSAGLVDLLRETFSKAGPSWDPENFDSLWILQERTAALEFGIQFYWGNAVNGNDPVILAGFGSFDGPDTSALDTTEVFLAHEFLHTMGMLDLYDVDAQSIFERWQYVGNFSPMGEVSGFANGNPFGARSTSNGNELFALEAWDLGWLNDSQIICADGLSATARLSGASQGGAKAIMVPVSSSVSLFAEVREQQRWDADIEAAGVLVYTFDETIDSGDGPIQVLGEHDGIIADGSILLQPGESISYGPNGRWVISVGSTSNGRYNVTVNDFGMCNGLPVTINMNTPGVTGVGTPGDDVIMGTPGRDIISSLGGNDTVCSLSGIDWIDLGPGDDTAFAGLDIDVVWGRTGRDTIHGEGGSDYLFGGTAKDTIYAGSGADRVFGEDGPDILRGMGGQDFMWGGDGDDDMQGSWQSDQMWGGAGNDLMRGAGGKDKLYGEAGNDDLGGGDNSDWLDGGSGNDVADGQKGRENPVTVGVQGCVAEVTRNC